MDSRATTAEPQHSYQSTAWPRITTSVSSPLLSSAALPLPDTPITILYPPHAAIYHAQLLNYNKLISPSRGGGVGLQTQPLPPVLSAPYVQATGPRSRSSSKSSQSQSTQQPQSAQSSSSQPAPQQQAQPQQPQSSKPQELQQHISHLPSATTQSHQNCHGNRGNKNADKSDRSVTKMGKETAQKAAAPAKSQQNQSQQSQQSQQSHAHNHNHGQQAASDRQPRPAAAPRSQQHRPSKSPKPHAKVPLVQASSVPSTPHQHARNFSFESREPSPSATQNHSPRSAYSETNATVPSLRPLPPRQGGCIYETSLVRSRRRMAYSLGTDRLDPVNLDKIKSQLSAEEEQTLTKDMRELYARLRPSEEKQRKREQFVNKLETIFNKEWPGHNIHVHIFGSSGNRLCSDDSDVDICITTDWKDMENVCMIAELLAKRGMEKVVCVSSAKVPIVKIWDPELSLACDMNVNNTLALENTRMVLTYVSIDKRVRPLAMIIKYWTRQRIINDAAFGGTLSSYTWICMVICFLQLRKTPILPALHQRQEDKLPRPDGSLSEFADDLTKLQGFGADNKETWGQLLFHFFRFYAYEFDYGQSVLSVRQGKLLTKTEKRWHTGINNMLCVEEPFNTVRNLGNTADDTSFRGLHMELRRAFDLISEAKLTECCEGYVFPKEEERVFQKPSQTSRPVMLRSSSQQHSGRGGRGGSFRGNRQYRSGNNSRRASSSVAYENNPLYLQPATMIPMMPQDIQWFQQQHQVAQQVQQHQQQAAGSQAQQAQQAQPQYVYHPDLLATPLGYSYYTTSPQAYMQQQHALAHAHRIQQQSGTSSATDRSRTNSFDNPPLTAPVRPEVFVYPMPLQAQPFFAMRPAGFTTLPSSPSTAAPAEYRRSYRAGQASDASSPTGTLRSQSQPASRTPMVGSQSQGNPMVAAQLNGSTTPTPGTQSSSSSRVPISFFPDENADSEIDDAPSKTASDYHSSEEENGQYMGYYVKEGSGSPVKHSAPSLPAAIAFGDLGQSGANVGRRRLSTDLPQTILDRRMRRESSRSPSPLGHGRAFSVGTSTAPLPSVPFPSALGGRPGKESHIRSPPVVDGSINRSMTSPSLSSMLAGTSTTSGPNMPSRQLSTSESAISEDAMSGSFPGPDVLNMACVSHGLGISGQNIYSELPLSASPIPQRQQSPVMSEAAVRSPPVVNGSVSAVSSPRTQQPLATMHTSPSVPEVQSFNQRVAAMNGFSPMAYAAIAGYGGTNGMVPMVSTAWQPRTMPRQQPKGIAPLDLAMPATLLNESQHLSPVYEHRTPSPTVVRRFEQLRQTPASTEPYTTSFASHAKNVKQARKETGGKSVAKGLAEAPTSRAETTVSASSTTTAPSTQPGSVRTNGTTSSTTNGHVRSAKSESGDMLAGGAWQKPKSRKKTADLKAMANGHVHGEQPPKNESERKGG